MWDVGCEERVYVGARLQTRCKMEITFTAPRSNKEAEALVRKLSIWHRCLHA